MTHVITPEPLPSMVGTVIPYLGPAAPKGFLICDGSAVNRNIYSKLLEEIGELYGEGNNVDTFNVPDFRGRFLLSTTDNNLVGTVGEDGINMDAFTIADSSNHNHTHANTTTTYSSIGNHTHTSSGGYSTGGSHHPIIGGGTQNYPSTTLSSGAHTHTGTSRSFGTHSHTATLTGGDGECVPRNVAVNYIIFTGV